MAVKQTRLAVSTTAVALLGTDDTEYRGQGLLARCDTTDWYVGGSDVTTANGYLVPAGVPFKIESINDAWYAIATGAITLYVVRWGVAA